MNQVIARQSLADFEASLERCPTVLTCAEAPGRYAESSAGTVMADNRLTPAAKVLAKGLGSLRVDQVTQSRWDIYRSQRMTKA